MLFKFLLFGTPAAVVAQASDQGAAEHRMHQTALGDVDAPLVTRNVDMTSACQVRPDAGLRCFPISAFSS
jgi:hypothetical protein